MPCSFTLNHYHDILIAALEAGYRYKGFHEEISNSQLTLYLRHDIDICLEEASEMARIEAELGIKATYFILINSPIYNPISDESLELLDDLRRKGHWIGLHIDLSLLPTETLLEVDQSISELISFYKNKIPLVPVISFHRPSKNILGHNFSKFISTYSQYFFDEIKYITDSRGIWREGCPCQTLKERKYPLLQLLIHPIWWRLNEEETLSNRIHYLLGKRLNQFKKYLGANIEPIGRMLQKEEAK